MRRRWTSLRGPTAFACTGIFDVIGVVPAEWIAAVGGHREASTSDGRRNVRTLGRAAFTDFATRSVHTWRCATRQSPIQQIAGQQNLSPTQRYVHLSPAAIEGAISC
jgi:hypothetical protein